MLYLFILCIYVASATAQNPAETSVVPLIYESRTLSITIPTETPVPTDIPTPDVFFGPAKAESNTQPRNIIIGVTIGCVSVFLLAVAFFYFQRLYCRRQASSSRQKLTDIED